MEGFVDDNYKIAGIGHNHFERKSEGLEENLTRLKMDKRLRCVDPEYLFCGRGSICKPFFCLFILLMCVVYS